MISAIHHEERQVSTTFITTNMFVHHVCPQFTPQFTRGSMDDGGRYDARDDAVVSSPTMGMRLWTKSRQIFLTAKIVGMTARTTPLAPMFDVFLNQISLKKKCGISTTPKQVTK